MWTCPNVFLLLQCHRLSVSFTLQALAFQLSASRRDSATAPVCVHIKLDGYHFTSAYMGMKTELLYSEPRFPNGYGDSSPKRTLKGRYILFSNALICSQFLGHQQRSGLLTVGPLICSQAKRQRYPGTRPGEQAWSALVTQMSFYGTLSEPHTSGKLPWGKTLCTFQRTFPRMSDVIRIEGSLRKQNFTRTEQDRGRPDTRFHKICSINAISAAYYPK